MAKTPVTTITGQDTIAAVGSVETIFGVTATGAEVALGQTTIQPNHLFGFTASGASYPSYIVTDIGPPPAAGGGAGMPVSVLVGANNTNSTTTTAGTLTAAESTTTAKTNNGNGGGAAHPGSAISMTIADVTPTTAQTALNTSSGSGMAVDPTTSSAPGALLVDTTQPPIIPA